VIAWAKLAFFYPGQINPELIELFDIPNARKDLLGRQEKKYLYADKWPSDYSMGKIPSG
jgi:hypothetical protein